MINDAGESVLYFDSVHLQEVRDEHLQKAQNLAQNMWKKNEWNKRRNMWNHVKSWVNNKKSFEFLRRNVIMIEDVNKPREIRTWMRRWSEHDGERKKTKVSRNHVAVYLRSCDVSRSTVAVPKDVRTKCWFLAKLDHFGWLHSPLAHLVFELIRRFCLLFQVSDIPSLRLCISTIVLTNTCC